MPYTCCVSTCKMASDLPDAINKKISFHSIPKKAKQKWQSILEPHCPTIYTRKTVHVCSRHFKEDSFHYPGLGKAKFLKNGCEPTIFKNFIAVSSSTFTSSPQVLPNTSHEVNDTVEVSTIALARQENAPQALLNIPSSTFTFSPSLQVLSNISPEVNNLIASLNIPPELQNVPLSSYVRNILIQLQKKLDQHEDTIKSLGSAVQEQAKRMGVLEQKLMVSDYNFEQVSHQNTELKEKLIIQRKKVQNLKKNLGRCREKLVEWNKLKRKLIKEKMLNKEPSSSIRWTS